MAPVPALAEEEEEAREVGTAPHLATMVAVAAWRDPEDRGPVWAEEAGDLALRTLTTAALTALQEVDLDRGTFPAAWAVVAQVAVGRLGVREGETIGEGQGLGHIPVACTALHQGVVGCPTALAVRAAEALSDRDRGRAGAHHIFAADLRGEYLADPTGMILAATDLDPMVALLLTEDSEGQGQVPALAWEWAWVPPPDQEWAGTPVVQWKAADLTALGAVDLAGFHWVGTNCTSKAECRLRNARQLCRGGLWRRPSSQGWTV